jgi:hypothetical protein
MMGILADLKLRRKTSPRRGSPVLMALLAGVYYSGKQNIIGTWYSQLVDRDLQAYQRRLKPPSASTFIALMSRQISAVSMSSTLSSIPTMPSGVTAAHLYLDTGKNLLRCARARPPVLQWR